MIRRLGLRLLTSLALLLALLLALAAPAQALATHLAACDLTQGNFPNGGTTSTFNSTGATELIVGLTYNDGQTATLSDSPTNTLVALNDPSPKTAHARLWHVTLPLTSATHSITVTGTNIFASVTVFCFAGTTAAPAIDQQVTNAADNVTSIQPGSLTPLQPGEVIVTVLGFTVTDTPTINGGFSTPLVTPTAGGQNYGIAASYLIQTVIAAASPTWSWTNVTSPTTASASILAASGAWLSLLGVGR